ncbi:hypothetical protein [Clostridium guangxiense]|uniref:hypothetical protein n=1 Tax=Clostridium guangxiense TaxID=1662055 RepID=UPI001E416597|nr:hypothetical protein [Clostridium guangxiense]MCD2345773.1 hypothetical protein [Clostridium guangxiense]
MTDEEKRTKIAYLQQGLEQIKPMISEKQYQERKETVDQEIKELGGENYGRRENRV